MNSYTSASILLGAAAVLLFLLLTLLAGRGRVGSRLLHLGLALCALLAAVFHLGVLDEDLETGERRLRAPPAHLRELYHYYLGTKYFAELGYAGLYEATVIADQVDDMGHFSGRAVIRDLRTYEGVSRADVAQRGPEIQGRFSPDRWLLFRDDVEMFRAAIGHEWWQEENWWQDHGYNGTPLVTGLLGGLANLDPDDGATFLNYGRWLDLALLPLLLLLLWRLHGARTALTVGFFWFINPLNDYNFIGGAYLRYTWAYALGLGIAFLGRGRGIVAGSCFAVSTALRVFPVLFVAGIVLHHLARPDRARALRARLPFLMSFTATLALSVGATWHLRTPEGEAAWPAFVHNMRMHAGSFGANQLGLSMPLVYDPANALSDERGADAWAARQEERGAERRLWILSLQVLALAAATLASRRLVGDEAVLLGVVLLFVLQPAAHYYYALLGWLPLAFRGQRRFEVSFACFALALMACFWPRAAAGRLDWVFALASGTLAVWLASVFVLSGGRERAEGGEASGG